MVRASDFLGYGRCFIALLEDGQFRVRWAVVRGESRRVDTVFPEGIATRALREKEVFWSDDLTQMAGANLEILAQYDAKQLLAVPLVGAEGKVLGMFGVLDRLDNTGISQHDIRRARALAAQVSVVLEVARNLHQSERDRKRSEGLAQLTREMNGLLHLPDFAGKFVERTIAFTGAQAGAVALFQDGRFQTVALHPPVAAAKDDRSLPQRFAQALSDLISTRTQTIVSGSAAELLGPDLASSLGWNDLTVSSASRPRRRPGWRPLPLRTRRPTRRRRP